MSEAPAPGSVLGDRFELIAQLGQGATGVVWRALDRESGIERAVKLLHPRLAENPRTLERFATEASAVSRLSHPAIARLVAVELSHRPPHLAFELAEGESLREILADRAESGEPLPLPVVHTLLDQLHGAVAEAHGRGVVHRDLKPDNILVDPRSWRLKIVDFGLAKLVEGAPSEATTRGRLTGAFAYLSPEQARGEPATAASDVFTCGLVAFELLTLRRPFFLDEDGSLLSSASPARLEGPNEPGRLLERVAAGPRPHVSSFRSDAPPALDALIAQALATDPLERPAADRLVGALNPAPERAPSRRAGRSVALTLAIALGLSAAVVWGVFAGGEETELTAIPVEDTSAPPIVAVPGQKVEPRASPEREAPPSVLEVEPAPRKATPSKPRRERPVHEPKKAVRPDLLAAARAAPHDARLRVELAEALLAEADGLEDATQRERVRRVVRSSLMAGDLEGLELAARMLAE